MESRKWLSLLPSSNNSLNNTQFTALSFNLLADALVYKKRYPYCSNKNLKWKNRSKRVLEELKLTGADILLVQEVDHYGGFYKKKFDLLGYHSIFNKNKANQHGLCIAFKKDKFDLISNLSVNFDDYPIGKNICPTKCILQLVKVQFKESKLGLILTNNHLFWNPTFDYERTRQFSIITEATKKFAKGCDFPIISGGDFNTTPDKLAYFAITRVLKDNEEDKLNIYNEINADLKSEINRIKEELEKCKEELIALTALKEIQSSNGEKDTNDANDSNDANDANDANGINNIKDTKDGSYTSDLKNAKDSNDANDASDIDGTNGTKGVKNTKGANDTKDINNTNDTKGINNTKKISKANNKKDKKDTKNAMNKNNTKDTSNTKSIKTKKNKKGANDAKTKIGRAIQGLNQKINDKELKLARLENPDLLPIEEIVKIIESSEPLQSAYSNYTKLDPTYLETKYGYEPIYTNFTPTFKGTLDYLFYRSSSNQQIEVESIFSLPDKETLGDGIPNLIYGSDHLSIAAKFIFK